MHSRRYGRVLYQPGEVRVWASHKWPQKSERRFTRVSQCLVGRLWLCCLCSGIPPSDSARASLLWWWIEERATCWFLKGLLGRDSGHFSSSFLDQTSPWSSLTSVGRGRGFPPQSSRVTLCGQYFKILPQKPWSRGHYSRGHGAGEWRKCCLSLSMLLRYFNVFPKACTICIIQNTFLIPYLFLAFYCGKIQTRAKAERIV